MPTQPLNSNPFELVDPATLVTDKNNLQEPPPKPNQGEEGEMETEQLERIETNNMAGQFVDSSTVCRTLENLKMEEGETGTGQGLLENAPAVFIQGNGAHVEGSLNVKCLLCLDVSTTSMSFSRPNEEVYLKNLFAQLGIYSSQSKLDRMKAEGTTIYLCTICRDHVVILSSYVQQMIRAQMKVREALCGILNSAKIMELNFQDHGKSCSTNNETTDRIRKKILIRADIQDP